MSDTTILERRPWPLAAQIIDEKGWTQNAWTDGDGHVCMHEAIKRCAPVPGDQVIIMAIAAQREHDTDWNDEEGRTKGEVTRWLRTTKPISDAELEQLYGPQWPEVIALIREAASLTGEQKSAIYAAYNRAWNDPAVNAAWLAVGVGVGVGPGGAVLLALWAFVDFGFVDGVAAALARRHEIKPEHYALLVAPWVAVTGRPVHPDDEPAVAA